MTFTRKRKGGKPHNIIKTLQQKSYAKTLAWDKKFDPGFEEGDVIENVEEPGEIKVIKRRRLENMYDFTDGSSEYIQEDEIIRNPDSEIKYPQKWRIVPVGAGKKRKTRRRKSRKNKKNSKKM